MIHGISSIALERGYDDMGTPHITSPASCDDGNSLIKAIFKQVRLRPQPNSFIHVDIWHENLL